jgi:hypothetical protein
MTGPFSSALRGLDEIVASETTVFTLANSSEESPEASRRCIPQVLLPQERHI